MNETMVTVIGNVTNDPTLRATSGGTRVTSFRLAATERRYDKSLGAWRDGDTVLTEVPQIRSRTYGGHGGDLREDQLGSAGSARGS